MQASCQKTYKQLKDEEHQREHLQGVILAAIALRTNAGNSWRILAPWHSLTENVGKGVFL